jgi:hypothetical protein
LQETFFDDVHGVLLLSICIQVDGAGGAVTGHTAVTVPGDFVLLNQGLADDPGGRSGGGAGRWQGKRHCFFGGPAKKSGIF